MDDVGTLIRTAVVDKYEFEIPVVLVKYAFDACR